MTNTQRRLAKSNIPNSGVGCQAVTLGENIQATRAIHVNTGGTAILTFLDGTTGTFTLAEGLYDYSLTKVATAGGTDPTLIAIY